MNLSLSYILHFIILFFEMVQVAEPFTLGIQWQLYHMPDDALGPFRYQGIYQQNILLARNNLESMPGWMPKRNI